MNQHKQIKYTITTKLYEETKVKLYLLYNGKPKLLMMQYIGISEHWPNHLYTGYKKRHTIQSNVTTEYGTILSKRCWALEHDW